MLPQNLPSLERTISDGADLRFDAAAAISFVEVAAARSASGQVSAGILRDFFLAAANAADKAAGGIGNAVALASTQAVVSNGVKVTAPVTGTGTSGVTPTVAAGSVTALVLS